jgi:hypothetical protein
VGLRGAGLAETLGLHGLGWQRRARLHKRIIRQNAAFSNVSQVCGNFRIGARLLPAVAAPHN